MQIRKISVTELFGLFDHSVTLKPGGITIIYGPNGIGKTKLLSMAAALLEGRSDVFRTTPFRNFAIEFTSGERLSVTRPREVRPNRQSSLTYALSQRTPAENPPTYNVPIGPERPLFDLDHVDFYIPQLERVGFRQWLDRATSEFLDLPAVVQRYGDRLRPPGGSPPPEVFTTLRARSPVRFIETQRLLRRGEARGREPDRWNNAVDMAARELADLVKDQLAKSAALSQSLDRTFPRRLVAHQSGILRDATLRARLAATERERMRLMACGLMEQSQDEAIELSTPLDTDTRRVLSLYVQDMDEKLKVFEPFATKLDLLRDIINELFADPLAWKSLRIDREAGFVVETKRGQVPQLSSLSSGEQHELVLFYDLLFNVKPRACVLIDEPELSLHIGWQMVFLEHLARVTKVSPLNVVIATHSPQIINDRWDLAVALTG